jgi:hypothetical protein
MAKFQFNASEVEVPEAPSYGPLPPGDYEVIVTKTDIRQTKAGTGEYIAVEFQVVGGAGSGRRLWSNYNVANANKQAEDIAKQQFAALCQACGVSDLEDTDELHDIPLIVAVQIDKKDETRNKIVAYKAASAPAPKAATKPAAPAGARPWQR